MADRKELKIIPNRTWSYNDIEYWINPKDNCCNAVINFEEKRSRLRAGILIIKDDEILLGEELDQPGEFSLPGGGIEKDETPVDAAKREAQEEVFINVKNARDTEYDYCETHTEVSKWVKKNVPEKKWWYNYYTCLIIADYDGDYFGNVDKVDLDKSMKATSRWYKIKDVINKPTFKDQWKKALIDFGYYKPDSLDFLTEDLKDDAKKYFGTTYNFKLGLYLNTDGTIIDGSGKMLGSSGTSRSVDHREIADIFEDGIEGNEAMNTYMNEGNIRLKPEAPGFELIKEPTKVQYEMLERLINTYKEEYYIDICNTEGYVVESFIYEYPTSQTIKDIKNYFSTREDYKEIFDTIWVYVSNLYDGGGWDQELQVKDHSITKTINNYRRGLGWNQYKVEYSGPGKTHINKQKSNENPNFTQISIFDDLNESLLKEDTRTTLISKSRSVDSYKGDTSKGANRFERKKYSKVANYVKQYNNIDMNEFYKSDILTVKIPVQGETGEYAVTLRMEGTVAEIQKNIKANNNKFEFRTVLQAITKIFNTKDIKVKCTCDDFKYHYAHNLIINNNSVDGTDKDPGAGKTGITAQMKGQGCKHILLCLANQDWIMKVASVIHNYTTYAETNMQKAFINIIFPKLYGMSANDAVDQNLVPEDTNMETDQHIIETINDWAKNRGKYKPGSNKNPVTGTGGRPKKEPEKEQETTEEPGEIENK